MLSVALASMVALSVQSAEIEKNNKSLELGLEVIEAFEHGPVILEVTLTNRGEKELEFGTNRLSDCCLQLPHAWMCGRYPCAGNVSTQPWTLKPGETLTERRCIHITYNSSFPAGTYSIGASWRLWTVRHRQQDKERQFAEPTRTFSVTITPATANNCQALADRLEGEFAALPKPSTREGDIGTALRGLCQKVVYTPHKELIHLALKLLERCRVDGRYRDCTSDLRSELVETLFEADPAIATHGLIDRLIIASPRVEPTSVFDVWRSDNWSLPDYADELLTDSLNPYWWVSRPFGEECDVLYLLFSRVSWGAPRILPGKELHRLASAKDFWVRAMVYSTFANRLTSEWRDTYLKEVRERFAPKLTAKQIEQMIHKLGHEEFAVREKAEADLCIHRWEAGPALAKATREDDSPEVRKRAQAILDSIKPAPPEGPPGRVIRCLSRSRPADRKLLEAIATGVKDNPVCKKAREILTNQKR